MRWRFPRRLALVLLILLCLATMPSLAFDAVLKHVIDGDTLDVLTPDGELRRVRLIGASAPELKNMVPCARYWANQAKHALTELVTGQPLRVGLDVTERDFYGRWLGYVWVGDILVNAVLIESGLAWAGESYTNILYRSRFDALESKAKREQRGLWAWPIPVK